MITAVLQHKNEERRIIKNKPSESSFPFSLANFTAQHPWYILIRKSEPTIRAVVKGVATLPTYYNCYKKIETEIECELPY